MDKLPKIIGYQVQNELGGNWSERPSYLILSEETAIRDLLEARSQRGLWLMIAIFDGDIEDHEFEDGYTPGLQPQVAELVEAAKPLCDLLFDDHPSGSTFKLEVDGGDVTRLKQAVAPFLPDSTAE